MNHNWEYKKLGEVCNIYQPKTISTNMLVEDGAYLVYGANGVIGRFDQYNHKERELLMTCRGATCGEITISEPYSWINGNAMVIHPTDGSTHVDFLKYQLRAVDLSCVITGAAQPQITRQSLFPLFITVPPLAIQEQIVMELDRICEIIEKKKQQIKELNTLAQSLFYEMFGDPVTNNKGWDVKKIGEVCFSKKYIERANKVFSTKEIIQYIDISSIDNVSHQIIATTQYTLGKAPSRAQQVVKYGDVLVSLVRPNLKNIASVCIKMDNLVASSGFCVLRINGESQHFLKSLILTNEFTRYANERVSGATYPAIKEEDIKDCMVGFPPLPLQQSFAEKIEAIERQKELINQSIKEAQTLFDSRMEHYFGN